METGGAVLMPWAPQVAAIANLFFGGEGTAAAWTRVMFGDVSPSGRLPVMLPATSNDLVNITLAQEVNYSEGLATSYRSNSFQAAFPFGHGLSYTQFFYSHPQLSDGDDCDDD